MKERILNEIKRLAEQNGGDAPGQRVFEQSTGITRGQWRGKLWATWTDALTEAGFAPNMVTEKLDPDTVLDCYEEACRRYSRPPTYGEWRMFVGGSEENVGVNSLQRAFGSTEGAVAALRNRAIQRGDGDLVALLPDESTLSLSEASAALIPSKEGSVYLLQSGGYYKIGRSDDLEKRVKQISIALPDKVELVHSIRTDDPPGIEAYWHRRFADRRKNGEWFELSPADVKAFKRRKYQ